MHNSGSKIEAGQLDLEPIEFNLLNTLNETTRPLRLRAATKGLKLFTHIEPGTPEAVVGDPDRLGQIITNLVSNAIKFTERGAIQLDVQLQGQSDRDVCLCFSVSDSGIGVPKEKQKLIFGSFVQADGSTTRRFGGTGLGLAISSQLVGLMDGRIWVESQEGKGSTFYFTVRLGRGPSSEAARALEKGPKVEVLSAAGPVRTKTLGLRILLVEDIEGNRVLTRTLLEQMGHSAVEACNGREAVKAFHEESFDLILMDIQLPEMSGIEATAAIRAIEKHTGAYIPIIAITAHAMKGDKEKYLKAGMDGYVSKPIQRGSLCEAIDQLAPVAPRT